MTKEVGQREGQIIQRREKVFLWTVFEKNRYAKIFLMDESTEKKI